MYTTCKYHTVNLCYLHDPHMDDKIQIIQIRGTRQKSSESVWLSIVLVLF
jgi:hypothetical protein